MEIQNDTQKKRKQHFGYICVGDISQNEKKAIH